MESCVARIQTRSLVQYLEYHLIKKIIHRLRCCIIGLVSGGDCGVKQLNPFPLSGFGFFIDFIETIKTLFYAISSSLAKSHIFYHAVKCTWCNNINSSTYIFNGFNYSITMQWPLVKCQHD